MEVVIRARLPSALNNTGVSDGEPARVTAAPVWAPVAVLIPATRVVVPVVASVTEVVIRARLPSALPTVGPHGEPVRVTVVPVWAPVAVLKTATWVVGREVPLEEVVTTARVPSALTATAEPGG